MSNNKMLVSQGHSLSDGLDDVQRAEMKAYMELVNNMLLTAEVHTHGLNRILVVESEEITVINMSA